MQLGTSYMTALPNRGEEAVQECTETGSLWTENIPCCFAALITSKRNFWPFRGHKGSGRERYGSKCRSTCVKRLQFFNSLTSVCGVSST